MQFISCQTWEGPLPRGYTCPESEADIANGGYASTNYLDDFSEALVQDKDGEKTKNAYKNFCEFENFEERLCEGDFVDKRVIEFLLDKGKA